MKRNNKMNKITETINSLIIDTWGGLLALWAAVVLFFSKLFYFIGQCAARGLVDKLVDSLMPRITKEIEAETAPIKDALKIYKEKKHKADNELNILRGAIVHNDTEYLQELRVFYKNEKRQK